MSMNLNIKCKIERLTFQKTKQKIKPKKIKRIKLKLKRLTKKILIEKFGGGHVTWCDMPIYFTDMKIFFYSLYDNTRS